eukprot:3767780-Amphidinium_carterae.1
MRTGLHAASVFNVGLTCHFPVGGVLVVMSSVKAQAPRGHKGSRQSRGPPNPFPYNNNNFHAEYKNA